MIQSQLNRAVSRATGEDHNMIAQRGFSLVDETEPLDAADLDELVADWDRIVAEQIADGSRSSTGMAISQSRTRLRRPRTRSRSAAGLRRLVRLSH